MIYINLLSTYYYYYCHTRLYFAIFFKYLPDSARWRLSARFRIYSERMLAPDWHKPSPFFSLLLPSCFLYFLSIKRLDWLQFYPPDDMREFFYLLVPFPKSYGVFAIGGFWPLAFPPRSPVTSDGN